MKFAFWRRRSSVSLKVGQIDMEVDARLTVSSGWQLGSDPEIQVATPVFNHLTAGVMKYFGDSFRSVTVSVEAENVILENDL